MKSEYYKEFPNAPITSNKYYFDCWKRDGKLKTKMVVASSEDEAISIFKEKYSNFAFDKPFV